MDTQRSSTGDLAYYTLEEHLDEVRRYTSWLRQHDGPKAVRDALIREGQDPQACYLATAWDEQVQTVEGFVITRDRKVFGFWVSWDHRGSDLSHWLDLTNIWRQHLDRKNLPPHPLSMFLLDAQSHRDRLITVLKAIEDGLPLDPTDDTVVPEFG